jgi:DNA polymerase I-like protein with 3'-5' exonuclease and polymerase domains
MMKMAAILLRDSLRNTSGKIVLLVHDEVLVECDKKDQNIVKQKVEESMSKAASFFCKQIQPPADAIINDCWYKA